MKKIISLLLVLSMCLVALCSFASCKKDDGSDTNKRGEQEDVPLAEADYTGKSYTVLYRDTDTYAAEWNVADTSSGSVIESAIFDRNAAVESRYGVALDFEAGRASNSWDDYASKISNSVSGGTDDYQLVAGVGYRLADYSANGYFKNLKAVNGISLNEEWWDGEFATAATYNGCCYVADGPLSLTGMKSSACIYFNIPQLRSRLGNNSADTELFQLMKDGKWTIDQFTDYVQKCTPEDTDGERTESDTYGLGSNTSTNVDAFIYAFDLHITTYKDGKPAIMSIGGSSNMVKAVEKVSKLFDTKYTYHQESNGDGAFTGMISAGLATFSTGTLSNAAGLREKDIEYGILPYPKWDEAQTNYYTYKLDYRTLFAIMKTVQDTEFVANVTEALAYYSNKYVKSALYESVLKYQDAINEDSSKAVDLILAGGRYDFANIYAHTWGDVAGPAHLFRKVVSSGAGIATEFASNKTFYETKLDTFLKSFVTE